MADNFFYHYFYDPNQSFYSVYIIYFITLKRITGKLTERFARRSAKATPPLSYTFDLIITTVPTQWVGEGKFASSLAPKQEVVSQVLHCG